MRIFDAHCHLQDNRIYSDVHKLIRKATEVGVQRFTVNGIFEVPKFLSFFDDPSKPFIMHSHSRFRVIGI